MHGGEENAHAFCVGGGGGHVLGEGLLVVDGQVGAAQDTDFDVAVDHQREAYGVLAAAEEAFGAVDGVESPDAAFGTAGAVAEVDGVEHLLLYD